MSSPATLLHDVLVVCEQTHEEWRSATAEIAEGLIFVPLGSFIAIPARTYTITARDGGERLRRFVSVTVDAARSTGGRVAFR